MKVLNDIFLNEYKFKEIFPEKWDQYIRSFHDQLRKGEAKGTIPRRKEKRWEWDDDADLSEVHRLIKEKYPEVTGATTFVRKKGVKRSGESGAAGKKVKKIKTKEHDGTHPEKEKKRRGRKAKQHHQHAQPAKQQPPAPAPAPTRTPPPLPQNDIWFPLSKNDVVKELLHCGKSAQRIIDLCGGDLPETTRIVLEFNICGTGKILE
eukprot:GEMP01031156.1.p1 GENE.GEMP01031156.1~~GEMP01031156.1.p1  ORF type:complete len:206 (+),score=56.42 GEMP01031156.1:118-735(+)